MVTPAMTPVEVVLALNDLIEQRRGLEAVDLYFADDFLEHDPNIAGGDKAGAERFLLDGGWTTPGGRAYGFHMDRIIASGEYVVTHQHVTEGPDDPILVFIDIYRVVDAKLVEHWHVGSSVPENQVNKRTTMY